MATVIYYLDDSQFCLSHVQQSLSIYPDLELQTFLEPANLWQQLEQALPDLILLDIEMPIPGIDIAQGLQIIYPKLKVIFFTATAKQAYLQDIALLNNCYGLLSKISNPYKLKLVIDQVASGLKVLYDIDQVISNNREIQDTQLQQPVNCLVKQNNFPNSLVRLEQSKYPNQILDFVIGALIAHINLALEILLALIWIKHERK